MLQQMLYSVSTWNPMPSSTPPRTVLHMGVVLLGMGIVLDMGEVIPGTDKEVVQAVYHMRYWTISAYR